MSLLDNSVVGRAITPAEFVHEFKHTWSRHLGYVSEAAAIFGMKPDAVARRLYRYKQQGFDITFIDDTKKWHRKEARRDSCT